MGDKKQIVTNCLKLLGAYRSGQLGPTPMPEDAHPDFENNTELQLAYFSLPMALNYQRNSYELWKSALKTYEDRETRRVFDVSQASKLEVAQLREYLMRYKLALQPNKHVSTWQTIATTVNSNFGSFQEVVSSAHNDYIGLRELVQSRYKKGFPYLSGPKIFNYWSFILKEYARVPLKNTQCIEIAPDTHVIQCSVKLQLITQEEAEKLSREEISARWRTILEGSGINPIDMHPPLWFWSRGGFAFDL